MEEAEKRVLPMRPRDVTMDISLSCNGIDCYIQAIFPKYPNSTKVRGIGIVQERIFLPLVDIVPLTVRGHSRIEV
ncbi:hypothetical protein QQP08_004470 [Theobroma cacao]|nr:hypothetical protein QQP08_004467 [Theobroma cacao]WRX11983.1 hypothetical protein QQP08_004470 [Theobroma cacao]